MPLTPKELLLLLNEKGFQTKTICHEAIFTVSDSQRICGKSVRGRMKNLFVKDKKDGFFLLVFEETAKVDLNRLHRVIGARSRLSFGKSEQLMEYLGITPGSVSAFCAINDKGNKVRVFIDKPLLVHEKINCHPLTNEMTTTISRKDLLQFLADINHKPEIVQMSEHIEDKGD